MTPRPPTPPDLDDDLQDLSARLHDLADRWEVRPPDGRPDLAPRRSPILGRWVPDWLRGGMVPVLAGVALVALVVAASAWLSTLGTAPAPVPADQAPGDAIGTIVDLLDEVPAEVVGDDPVVVTMGNLLAATDMAGLDRPTLDDPQKTIDEWSIASLSGGGGASPQPDEAAVTRVPDDSWMDWGGWRDELGWSFLDVDQFVDVSPGATRLGVARGTTPFERFTVVTGPATTATLPDSLRDVGDGILQAGTDTRELADSTPARLQGGPLFLAQADDRMVATGSRDGVVAWRADGLTLADDAMVADLASNLAVNDPTTAVLDLGTFAYDPEVDRPLGDATVLPAPIEAVGIAWSRDQDGPRVDVVYHHPSEDDASRNAQALPDLWRTATSGNPGRTFHSIAPVESVAAIGDRDVRVVLRPATGQDAELVFQALEFRDLPFLHAADDEPVVAGDGSDPSPLAGVLDDAEVLSDDFAAEMLEVDAEPLADRLSNRANGPARDFGETLHDGLDLTREARTDGGWLRVHAGCVGEGQAAILARATGTTNSATLRPSDPIPCDGIIHRVELAAPDAPVRIDLVAIEDGVTVVRSWLAAAELPGPTGAPGAGPTFAGWSDGLRAAGDPPVVVAGDDSLGVARHAGGATLMGVQWQSGATLDGVFAVRCSGIGTISVANGDNPMAEELPCDGSTHRLDLVAAAPPVVVAAHDGLVTTGMMIAVLTDDELGATDLTTG